MGALVWRAGRVMGVVRGKGRGCARPAEGVGDQVAEGAGAAEGLGEQGAGAGLFGLGAGGQGAGGLGARGLAAQGAALDAGQAGVPHGEGRGGGVRAGRGGGRGAQGAARGAGRGARGGPGGRGGPRAQGVQRHAVVDAAGHAGDAGAALEQAVFHEGEQPFRGGLDGDAEVLGNLGGGDGAVAHGQLVELAGQGVGERLGEFEDVGDGGLAGFAEALDVGGAAQHFGDGGVAHAGALHEVGVGHAAGVRLEDFFDDADLRGEEVVFAAGDAGVDAALEGAREAALGVQCAERVANGADVEVEFAADLVCGHRAAGGHGQQVEDQVLGRHGFMLSG